MKTDEIDAYSRLGHIIYLPISNVWLPGFSYIMRIFSIIPDNGTFFNYRLGIYIFSLLASLVIFLIILKVTRQWIIALLGLIIFLFHPLTIQLSVITLTEIPWIFFILLSIYFIFFSEYKHRVILGLLFFVLSQTIRYESWFLIPLFIIYFFTNNKKNLRCSIYSSVTILVIPILWLLVENLQYNNPFTFVYGKLNNQTEYFELYWNLPLIIKTINEELNEFIFPYLYIIALLISGLFLKNKKITYVSIGAIYLIFCFIFQTFISFNDNTTPRYFYFLIPAISILIPVCLSKISDLKMFKSIKIIFIYFIFLLIINQFKNLNNNFYSQRSLAGQNIENLIDQMNLLEGETIYNCLPEEEYYLKNLIFYKQKYKNVSYCDLENIFNDKEHGKLLITKEFFSDFNDKRDWVDRKIFQDYILYEF